MSLSYQLLHGDCLQVMPTLPENSVSSIITDPPYALSFLGAKWDHGIPGAPFWKEALRVAKPGAYLLACGAPRTVHRLACAIEDAGWELRDQLMWVFGGGMQKGLDVRKSLEKHGAKEAEQWFGFGTTLRPGYEPIVLARKPLIGTVAENIVQHGTGALNIDGCRIDPTGESKERVGEASQDRRYTKKGVTNFAAKPGIRGGNPKGRWPANLIHSGEQEVLDLFPTTTSGLMQAGQQRKASKGDGGYSGGRPDEVTRTGTYGDTGSAARYFRVCPLDDPEAQENSRLFYTAKANHADRGNQTKGALPLFGVEEEAFENLHPTCKPTSLMRYLCRLVTPPKGVILDPFFGSGSTGVAAVLEGFNVIGIEMEEEYIAIARQRLEAVARAR